MELIEQIREKCCEKCRESAVFPVHMRKCRGCLDKYCLCHKEKDITS